MKRISKNTMEKKNFFAPWAKGLGATRRAAVLLLVMLLTMAQTAWAQSGSCGDNLTWELNYNTLTISGSGAMYDYGPGMNPWNSYASDIQTVVIGDGVMSIGNNAFSETAMTSVEIPASVWSIGVGAFSDCTGLTSIEIPSGVTSIGEYVFQDCYNLASMAVALQGHRDKEW